jgi:hypothetical protein
MSTPTQIGISGMGSKGGFTAGSPGGFRLVLDEPGQMSRLAAFRAAHPDVLIRPGEFGTWQALIPEANGETVITRYLLRELLDKLDAVLSERTEIPGQGDD